MTEKIPDRLLRIHLSNHKTLPRAGDQGGNLRQSRAQLSWDPLGLSRGSRLHTVGSPSNFPPLPVSLEIRVGFQSPNCADVVGQT